MSTVEFTPNDYDLPHEPGTIRLVTGRYINLLQPRPDQIHIDDISVAEHSLHVSSMLQRQTGDVVLALIALLHDAAEAYLGDVVRPLKHSSEMQGYRDAELRMEQAIATKFGLASLSTPSVKKTDGEILHWEMAMFRDSGWRTPTDPAAVASAFRAQRQTADENGGEQ